MKRKTAKLKEKAEEEIKFKTEMNIKTAKLKEDKEEKEIIMKQNVEIIRKADKVEVARNLLLGALIMQSSQDTTWHKEAETLPETQSPDTAWDTAEEILPRIKQPR